MITSDEIVAAAGVDVDEDAQLGVEEDVLVGVAAAAWVSPSSYCFWRIPFARPEADLCRTAHPECQ